MAKSVATRGNEPSTQSELAESSYPDPNEASLKDPPGMPPALTKNKDSFLRPNGPKKNKETSQTPQGWSRTSGWRRVNSVRSVVW